MRKLSIFTFAILSIRALTADNKCMGKLTRVGIHLPKLHHNQKCLGMRGLALVRIVNLKVPSAVVDSLMNTKLVKYEVESCQITRNVTLAEEEPPRLQSRYPCCQEGRRHAHQENRIKRSDHDCFKSQVPQALSQSPRESLLSPQQGYRSNHYYWNEELRWSQEGWK